MFCLPPQFLSISLDLPNVLVNLTSCFQNFANCAVEEKILKKPRQVVEKCQESLFKIIDANQTNNLDHNSTDYFMEILGVSGAE